MHFSHLTGSLGGGGVREGEASRVWRWCWVTFIPERPIILNNSRIRSYCACNRCGWGLSGYFFSLSYLFSFFFSMRDGSILTENLFPKAVTLNNNQSSLDL